MGMYECINIFFTLNKSYNIPFFFVFQYVLYDL